jgi:cytochrome b involved in lipid metabolism
VVQKSVINWGPDPATLPVYTREQVRLILVGASITFSRISILQIAEKVATGHQWVILDGFVLDTEAFQLEHPGGRGILKVHYYSDCLYFVMFSN